MNIRTCTRADIPALIDLTIKTFRPYFEDHLPGLLDPVVFAHDHGPWQQHYREDVPGYHDPANRRFITLAEHDGVILGYVGWRYTENGTAHMIMVAVHPEARRQGVARTLCQHVLAELKEHGAKVVHIGTGGDAFHAPARTLYESLGFNAYPVVDYTRAV